MGKLNDSKMFRLERRAISGGLKARLFSSASTWRDQLRMSDCGPQSSSHCTVDGDTNAPVQHRSMRSRTDSPGKLAPDGV